jgi:hypothetical protein
MKDQELILRFFALFHNREAYKRPMKSSLTDFMKEHRHISDGTEAQFAREFEDAISLVSAALGRGAFRPQANINAAVFDAVMVGVAERLRRGPITDLHMFQMRYYDLLADAEFKRVTERATADEKSAAGRIDRALQAFRDLK